MQLDDLKAKLDAIEENIPVLVAGTPTMPITDVIVTPRAIILWPSLTEEEEDSLLSIDIMQDQDEQWRLVVFDKLNQRTMMVGRPYSDFLVAEFMWANALEHIDDFTNAFAKGLDEVNSYLNQLEYA